MSKETFLHSTTMMRKRHRTISGEPYVVYCHLMRQKELPVVVMIHKLLLSKQSSIPNHTIIRKFRGRNLFVNDYGLQLEVFNTISQFVRTININEMK